MTGSRQTSRAVRGALGARTARVCTARVCTARGTRAARGERGQSTLEFVGLLPLVLFVILVCLQALITVVAYERVHHAARNGARVMSLTYDSSRAQDAARGELPAWLVKAPSLPLCQEGETPAEDDCLATYRCVEDGENKPYETTCVHASRPATVTVRTEIPLLFPGAPLVIPVEQTVKMPATGGGYGEGDGQVQTLSSNVPSAGVANQSNRRLGRSMAAERGWVGRQWRCLDQLWRHESGWSHTADNPTSSAYGIPQALTHLHPMPAGYRTDPEVQIRWGLDYIARRYGTPCEAWRKWQSRYPHWY